MGSCLCACVRMGKQGGGGIKNGRRKGDAAAAAAALALARVVVVVWGWIWVREDPPAGWVG